MEKEYDFLTDKDVECIKEWLSGERRWACCPFDQQRHACKTKCKKLFPKLRFLYREEEVIYYECPCWTYSLDVVETKVKEILKVRG